MDLKTVAPYAGAWIETGIVFSVVLYSGVAPYAGAWIETHPQALPLSYCPVAPFAGAWVAPGGPVYTAVPGSSLHRSVVP